MVRLRFAIGLAALSLTNLLVGLLLAATVYPLVTGHDRVVLLSGSMAPTMRSGDIVVYTDEVHHPVPAGTVLVFRDPAHPEHLLTHRVVRLLPDGTYQTKGDANASPDSTPLSTTMVVGQGRMLVAGVGLPAAWSQQGHPERSLLIVPVVVLLLWLSRYGVLTRYEPWPPGATAPAASGAGRTWRPRRRAAVGIYGLVLVATVGAVAGASPHLARAAYSAKTVNPGNYLKTSLAFYLKTNATGNTTSTAELPLRQAVPTLTTLFNYDTNRDTSAGLLLVKSPQGLTDGNSSRIQKWNMTATTPLVLSGTGQLTLWSAMKLFDTAKSGSVRVGIYDCNPARTSCTSVAQQTVSSGAGSWSGGSPTWVSKTWSFGTLTHTVPAGNVLQVRVVADAASGDDMWFAYDTKTYTSVFTVS